MVHNSVYEDHFVSKTASHTVALVINRAKIHEMLQDFLEALGSPTLTSFMQRDEHIKIALMQTIYLSKGIEYLLYDDYYLDVSIWLVDCDDLDKFLETYLWLILSGYDELISGVYRFDREERIKIGEFDDALNHKLDEYYRLDQLIAPWKYDFDESDLVNFEENFEHRLEQDQIVDEVSSLRVIARQMLDEIKLATD